MDTRQLDALAQPGTSPSRPVFMDSAQAENPEEPRRVPHTQMSEYDDLLSGLEADDLNDFEGLDDFDDSLDPHDPVSAATGGNAPIDSLSSSDPFASPHFSIAAGFTTGKGNAIAPPSKAALEKAARLFRDIDTDADFGTTQDVTVDNKRRRIEPDRPDEEEIVLDDPAPDFTMSQSTGFLNGRGQAVPPPSKAALQKAALLLSAADQEDDTAIQPDTPSAPLRSPSGFTTGSGNAVPGPSKSALDRVAHIFADADHAASEGTESQSTFITPVKLGEQPSQQSDQQAADERRRKAMAIFGEDDIGMARPSTSMLPPVASTPFRPLMVSALSPRSNSAIPQAASSTQFRTPLRPTTNTFSQNRSSTPTALGTKPFKSIEIKTPTTTPRRVGMGLTPMSRAKSKKTFVTPFKNGSKLSGSPLRNTTAPRISSLPASTLHQEVKSPILTVPVFNLIKPPDRRNAKGAFLHPQYNSIQELKEMGLPDEIWQMELTNALQYQFIAEDGTTLNHAHALTVLKRDGCHLATAKWVDNHWPLILWKLGGQVQAKPALFDERWNWGEVIAQLKYRYEREFGQAQRPIVRRIQEHDSSPSLPMILCVAAVRWVEMPAEDGQEPEPPRPYLELTDGWYKIVAEVDECLRRAVSRDRIMTGRKLAISGAKLDSGAEGAEVLEAFDKSRLILSGNSTSLARWHEKLGAQPQPFVAGLSSLSVDGGQIALMDIIVDKLYPVAFIHSQKGSKEGPWSEDVERTKADQWKERYEAESTALREKTRKRLEGLEDLVESLVSAAQDVSEVIPTTPPDSLEREFDEMLHAPDASARLRSLPASHLIHLASYARGRMEQEIAEGQAEIEAELSAACPPRDVRNFRMARISDAREGVKDPARVGMLNIWDVKSLGEDVLREGGRYLVSNLMPGRQGDWSVPKAGGGLKEIYLHTRRDTRWKEVEHVA